MTAAALAVLLAAFACFFRGDFGRLSRIAGLPGAAHRRRRARVRIARTLLLFGGSALLALLLIGRGDALATLPREFAPLVAAMGGADDGLIATVAIGIALGCVAGLVLTRWRRRRGKPPLRIGDFAELLPRDAPEAGLAAIAALAAGVGEELYFRLALPLVLTTASGSAMLATGAATLLFGAAHRYQRWPGVVATTLVGALFAGIYLLSGRLWLAMAAHAAVDLNALVLIPWAAGTVARPARG